MLLALRAVLRRAALRVLGDPFHPRDPELRHPERQRRRQRDDDVAREERRSDYLAHRL